MVDLCDYKYVMLSCVNKFQCHFQPYQKNQSGMGDPVSSKLKRSTRNEYVDKMKKVWNVYLKTENSIEFWNKIRENGLEMEARNNDTFVR